MLQLILGRAGTGKTEYVFSSIKKLIDRGEKDILLITPEQFSFIAERRLLQELGESRVNRVSNLSFSRLADEIRRQYGGSPRPLLSKGAKAIMMKHAIEQVQEELVLFQHHVTSVSFINSFIKIYDEMKSCRVSVADIEQAAQTAERDMLRHKLGDIARIIAAYDALIDGVYDDAANELTRLYHQLLTLDYFKDRIVFIDGFNGFVAQEYKILEVILQQAKTVCLTLCSDSFNNTNQYDLFSYINWNIGILKGVLEKKKLPMAQPVFCGESKRFHNKELALLERNLFKNVKNRSEEEPEHIQLYRATDITDECDRIAAQIAALLREGYRASEIAVIVRDLDRYEQELSFAFHKYGVPYFDDERQAITAQPLMMFVRFLLRIFIYSYQSEDIFSLLKTGLCDLDCESISALENYVYLWSIRGTGWKKEFTESPKGFAEELSEHDKKVLDALNTSRAYIVDTLTAAQRKMKKKNAAGISKAIYETLMAFSCDKKLKELAMSLDKDGRSALAQEQGRIWDLLMDILDTVALVGNDAPISVREYEKLFTLMVSNEDLGTVPIGLDNVQLGAADRMRCDNPRAVFVAGANEGEFPKSVLSAGLLSEKDRVALVRQNLKLYSYGDTLNAQEKYFAYMALCSAREKLYVSYSVSDSESEIVRELKDIFPRLPIQSRTTVTLPQELLSKDKAFEILAGRYEENTPFIRSLEAYFEGEDSYHRRLQALRAMKDNAPVTLHSRDTAIALFGKDMYLSASRIEDYYNCAFRYFCKFGLGARPRIKAAMDPMQTGTVIHYVLEQIIKEKGSDRLVSMDTAEIRVMVHRYLTTYLETKMGDAEQFTPRFKYQFMRLSKMLVSVIERLQSEFAQSDFVPEAFELTIGSEGEAEVKSRRLPLPDGGSIEIKGAVDRVDYYEKDGVRYVRVVDYKSGTKEFELSDILYGLNLQMFIYLFTVSESEGPYRGVAGGVLYMHSARNVLSLNRNDDIERQVAAEENKQFKMKGMILNDEEHALAEHMEHGLNGRYIPAKFSKKAGAVTGNVATLAELGSIATKVEQLVIQMGASLHSGGIQRYPIHGKNHDKTCEFCDYRAVCMNQREIEYREMEPLDYAGAMEKMKEESDA